MHSTPKSTARPATRRTLVSLAKVALAAAILGYLIVEVQRHDGLERLVEQPKNWPLLAVGLACTFGAITLSFVRWHVLIRALGLPMRLTESLWLGSIGFALNFVSLGMVGGDLFKAIFLAHRQPRKRTEAVATVVADRMVGLMTQLVLASAGILAAGLRDGGSVRLRVLCDTILLVTAGGLVATALVFLMPGLIGPRVAAWCGRAPLVGRTIARLIEAARVYRDQRTYLAAACGLSVVGVLLYISSFYFVAHALPVHEPGWAEHLVIVPVASLAGAIPATPSGLGTFEAAAEALYRAMPGSTGVVAGDGTMVALAHRLTMIAVAMIGVVYYLSHRRKFRAAMNEAEEENDERQNNVRPGGRDSG